MFVDEWHLSGESIPCLSETSRRPMCLLPDIPTRPSSRRGNAGCAPPSQPQQGKRLTQRWRMTYHMDHGSHSRDGSLSRGRTKGSHSARCRGHPSREDEGLASLHPRGGPSPHSVPPLPRRPGSRVSISEAAVAISDHLVASMHIVGLVIQTPARESRCIWKNWVAIDVAVENPWQGNKYSVRSSGRSRADDHHLDRWRIPSGDQDGRGLINQEAISQLLQCPHK